MFEDQRQREERGRSIQRVVHEWFSLYHSNFFTLQFWHSHPHLPQIVQLHPKRPLSHCWQSPRLGFFPPTLPDGFHDHAGLPGPVPSLLCLRHGAPLAVLPCCRRRGYESRERRLLWHPVPARRPLPPGQTQTPPKHSPQLLVRGQQRTPGDAATSSAHALTGQTLREEKWWEMRVQEFTLRGNVLVLTFFFLSLLSNSHEEVWLWRDRSEEGASVKA